MVIAWPVGFGLFAGSVNACEKLDWDWIGIEHGYCEDCLGFGLSRAWKIGICLAENGGISKDIQSLELCLNSFRFRIESISASSIEMDIRFLEINC